MFVGSGVSSYDLSSMEKYGSGTNVATAESRDLVDSSQSQVTGIQTMFKLHRQEKGLIH